MAQKKDEKEGHEARIPFQSIFLLQRFEQSAANFNREKNSWDRAKFTSGWSGLDCKDGKGGNKQRDRGVIELNSIHEFKVNMFQFFRWSHSAANT